MGKNDIPAECETIFGVLEGNATEEQWDEFGEKYVIPVFGQTDK